MKLELTDNELQMYNAKVRVWQEKLYEYIIANYASDLRIEFSRCLDKANNFNTFTMKEIKWDAPEYIEKYGKSNCLSKIIKEFNEKHPFPKLIEI